MKKFLTLLLLVNSFILSDEPTLNNLFELLEQGANQDYIGEPVSQLEHALQCGQLALDSNSDTETILAAFLHDIGHLCASKDAKQMDGFGVAQHELIGAEYIKKLGFSTKVTELMKSHVDAKRYLIHKKGDQYYNQLSDASRETLKRQGGMMTATEAQLFEADLLFKEKIELRLWDEKAKIKDAKTKDLNFFKELCIKHLQKN
ncbi:MAG: HD domain-containing protein [Candidatus Babeliales bacterium]|nr:HD domain-containing protein [Candidatus Babeliales bacterium]